MKNDSRNSFSGRENDRSSSRLPTPLRWIWNGLSRNLIMKLVSLLLAILLWNYVISTNTSITRPKTLNNLTGYITGQSTLNGYGLALLEDPSEELSNISVTIEAPQANYSRVSNDNVQVMLDLSNVRTAGTQEVRLRATTSYGRISSIVPDSLTLTFEVLDSRSVPVNCQIIGEQSPDYWYNIGRVNPSVLTVSGAASVVRGIVSGYVYEDVTGLDNSTMTALPYVLLDANGEEVDQSMLIRSTSSISVSLDVYPCRDIPISTDLASVVTGQPAEGYVVQSVTIQPESVTVAAEEELLDSLAELMVEPVSVNGASQSFSARASLSALSGFKYYSNDQVYVNVVIEEEKTSGWIENVDLLFSGAADSLNLTYEPIRVYATGPRSTIEQIQQEGVSASVDLSGLAAGKYQITPTFDAELYPNVEFQTEAIPVTLTDAGSDD